MRSGLRVLIVDPSQENREVLKAALERRGIQILEAQRADEGRRLIARHHPDLVLVDADETAEQGDDLAELAADERPTIVLGRARLAGQPLAQGEFVRKPYHYAPLIRKIEALLAKAA